ncbi:MAG TPA: hypothetical protein VGK19_10865 [Capsulimonadaceae bacterium]|jgi:hypothetical protein
MYDPNEESEFELPVFRTGCGVSCFGMLLMLLVMLLVLAIGGVPMTSGAIRAAGPGYHFFGLVMGTGLQVALGYFMTKKATKPPLVTLIVWGVLNIFFFFIGLLLPPPDHDPYQVVSLFLMFPALFYGSRLAAPKSETAVPEPLPSVHQWPDPPTAPPSPIQQYRPHIPDDGTLLPSDEPRIPD